MKTLRPERSYLAHILNSRSLTNSFLGDVITENMWSEVTSVILCSNLIVFQIKHLNTVISYPKGMNRILVVKAKQLPPASLVKRRRLVPASQALSCDFVRPYSPYKVALCVYRYLRGPWLKYLVMGKEAGVKLSVTWCVRRPLIQGSPILRTWPNLYLAGVLGEGAEVTCCIPAPSEVLEWDAQCPKGQKDWQRAHSKEWNPQSIL